jgi:uncharacterized protein
MSLPITLTLAAAAALINMWLMIRCGQARTSEKVSVGDGGSEFLIRRMRAHSNFIESAPIVLILIGALEASGGTSNWLWAVGIAFTIGRLAHALGMDGGALGRGRMLGTLLTFLTLIVLAVMALVRVYSNLG